MHTNMLRLCFAVGDKFIETHPRVVLVPIKLIALNIFRSANFVSPREVRSAIRNIVVTCRCAHNTRLVA